ncbi:MULTISPECIES: chorismate mutase [Pseudovibrio]|uniref:chorismate mutase n=1 Tax=Stappiaceae TaxID=2821832 RepID=UPI002365A6D5|nr:MULTISPECIES: chorismate mutase [Pseudovibrio]MDD7909788.1 chorismate mutase [Pseudovibrio exalbescens]MDX5592128.1 chorismate mutase [Pseudovibrio sp. SPO723]
MNRLAQDCADMTQLRQEIDRLDKELISLFAERWSYINRAAEIKKPMGLPARINERVEEVARNVRAHADAENLNPDFYEGLWRQLMEQAIAREEAELGTS